MNLYQRLSRPAMGLAAAILLLAGSLPALAVLKVDATGPGGQPLPNATVSIQLESGGIRTGQKDESGLYIFPDLPAGFHNIQVTDTTLGATENRTISVTGRDQTIKVGLDRPGALSLEYPELSRYGVEASVGASTFLGDSPIDSGLEFSLLGRVALFGVLINNAMNWPQSDNFYLFLALSSINYDAGSNYDVTGHSFYAGVGWYLWLTNNHPLSHNSKYRLGVAGRLYGGYTRAKIEWRGQSFDVVEQYDVVESYFDGIGYRDQVVTRDRIVTHQSGGGSETDGSIILGGSIGPRLRNVNSRWDIGADLGGRVYLSPYDFGLDDSGYDARFEALVTANIGYSF